jgi:hypothetical protein
LAAGSEEMKVLGFFQRGGIPFEAYIALFIFIYLGAWAANGLYGTKFDLPQLVDLFQWLIGYSLGQYATNSIFNSPRGAKPKGGSDCATSNPQRHSDNG